jgi:hypothetical protein
VSKDSAAGERLAKIRGDSGRMVLTPAYAWLEGFDNSSDKDIKEDSVIIMTVRSRCFGGMMTMTNR